MSKVFVPMLALAAVITLIPLGAAADDSSVQGQSSGGLTAPSADGSLGPATGTSTDAGSSSADSSTLQPAGTSPLQSTTGDSTGLSAPNSNALQAPAATNGQLQVISGDADGAPHQISASQQLWLWAAFSLLFGLIAAGAVWFWRRRSRRSIPSGSDQPATTTPEPTSSQRLTVTIDRPAADIFAFILDPASTPKWIDAISEEEASEQPPKVGTVYRNRDDSGHWTEYELTKLSQDKTFELTNHTNGYRVRYTLTPLNETSAELEYYERVDDGVLEHPFTGAELEKLKAVLESGNADSEPAKDEPVNPPTAQEPPAPDNVH